jgi:hypothetical protein
MEWVFETGRESRLVSNIKVSASKNGFFSHWKTRKYLELEGQASGDPHDFARSLFIKPSEKPEPRMRILISDLVH